MMPNKNIESIMNKFFDNSSRLSFTKSKLKDSDFAWVVMKSNFSRTILSTNSSYGWQRQQIKYSCLKFGLNWHKETEIINDCDSVLFYDMLKMEGWIRSIIFMSKTGISLLFREYSRIYERSIIFIFHLQMMHRKNPRK